MTTPTIDAEARAVCKFTCPNYSCHHMFRTKLDMRIHAGKYKKKKDLYEVKKILDCKDDAILDCKGDAMSRTYKVRWAGYPPEEDQ